MPIQLAAYAYPHTHCAGLPLSRSPALRITTVQARRTPVHDDEGLGAALVAERGGRREAGAVAGDGDVFVGGGLWDCAKSAPIPAFPR